MCMVICVMIGLGAVLNIVGQALDQELVIKTKGQPPSTPKEMRLLRGSQWCINLSYLMGAVALLLILCCLCCRDVDFGHGEKHDDYE